MTYTVTQPATWIATTTVSLSWSDTDESGIAGSSYVSTTLDQNPSVTPSMISPPVTAN